MINTNNNLSLGTTYTFIDTTLTFEKYKLTVILTSYVDLVEAIC